MSQQIKKQKEQIESLIKENRQLKLENRRLREENEELRKTISAMEASFEEQLTASVAEAVRQATESLREELAKAYLVSRRTQTDRRRIKIRGREGCRYFLQVKMGKFP